MKYILSIDQGTTSSRAMVFDKNANIKGFAQKNLLKFIHNQVGWNMILQKYGAHNLEL